MGRFHWSISGNYNLCVSCGRQLNIFGAKAEACTETCVFCCSVWLVLLQVMLCKLCSHVM
ncbi:hypothetical protein F2Q70_00028614 [Brassica cretica]|uniref:Uncharacterized protein n=1 Tax=Brassica cretica TaxID=69181 RepID=A0A8S9LGF3_BRACR|nr:hypothetical protein F2Q70_00028614 [Brassica cretica]